MKKLLIISETWYPDSRATISIMARMAGGISAEGVTVYAMPLGNPPKGGTYPAEHSGIRIIPADSLVTQPDHLKLQYLKIGHRFLQKLLYAEKRLISGKPCPWNKRVQQMRNYQRKSWLDPVDSHIRSLALARDIAVWIEKEQIDSVISISLPFWIHETAALTMDMIHHRRISWVPICFDPYAYDQSTGTAEQRRRCRTEQRVYRRAKQILMLSQSAQDYAHDPLREKISFFEIPNLRKLVSGKLPETIAFDASRINCVFIGNLYWTVRNPEYLLRLFQCFSDTRISLYMIGSLSYDFPQDYLPEWERRLGERFRHYDRIPTDAAAAVLNAADILINIGNTTSNQCPSKVMEYISSGKPVINIAKIENCTSQVYLERYPLACLIREADGITPELAEQVEDFIVRSRGKKVDFHQVEAVFGDCTNESAVRVVLDAFA